MTAVINRQRAQEVHDLARARAGLPYSYGGAFTRDPRVSTDCSGLVLQTAAWYTGRADWPGNRYGSTESFRLNHRIVFDLGFKRLPKGGIAELGFTPVMLVGLQHGGGGVYSHTACTLMTMDKPGGPVVVSKRGVDWESQGDGVFLYDGARAWNDPLFHDYWFLDAKLEAAAIPAGPRPAARILADAMGGSIPPERYEELLPGVVRCFREGDINTVKRRAMWLAQVGHESGGLRYQEEIASGAAYEGRADLGNTRPGDGTRYKGRDFIQVTGRHNYTALSKWAFGRGLTPSLSFFVDQPDKLATDEYAFVGTAWYWSTQRPMNAAADAGDLEAATRYVNGGLNGLADRRARYDKALAMGEQLLAITLDNSEEAGGGDMAELMAIRVKSMSIYANPGEPDVPLVDMFRAMDAHGPHEQYVEHQARLGEPDALFRVARTAAGKGIYGDAPFAVNQAAAVLAEIKGVSVEEIRTQLKGVSA